jgi:RNA polymerase primary sigma factor
MLDRTQSSLSVYWSEISRVPLLTRREEEELAMRVARGDDRAREQLIRANLRLVVKVARDYEGLGLSIQDLVGEGNIGLMKAAERFRTGRGAKFSTYACWWIKNSLRRALSSQSRTIRVPVGIVDRVHQLRRAEGNLYSSSGGPPTEAMLSKVTGLSRRQIRRCREGLPVTCSLDRPLTYDRPRSLIDTVPDEQAPTPLEELEQKADPSILDHLISKLDSRQRTILQFRYGLDGVEPLTLEQIGRLFGLTRERIRQLEAAALSKLRRLLRRAESLPDALPG